MSVIRCFKTLRCVTRYGIWLPHVLEENKLMNGTSIYDSLHRRNKTSHFLKERVNGENRAAYLVVLEDHLVLRTLREIKCWIQTISLPN